MRSWRVSKWTLMASRGAVREMYITLKKADKEVELAKRHGETAKVKTAEVQAAIQKNNMQHRQKRGFQMEDEGAS
ncbi:hypothetical protein Pyn_19055 [Prunus yedoensis var. nudiflora]|uniref:Uncharacterized protein n=1 Tax=Prunus yedoensis var. nudiflora TaxID=2094558 RepID=A0A315A2H4_PRUYE|nr:hypothetical protein Pyn_19055 [Prunus yedoensis var. nudiflora]